MAKAAAKMISNSDALKLAEDVLRGADTVSEISAQLKEAKAKLDKATKDLTAESVKIFETDMGQVAEDKTPDVFGNHEYIVGQRVVNVNFKMKSGGFSMREISGHKACDILPKVLGDEEYKKLFIETEIIEEDDAKLIDVQGHRPDLVGYRLIGELPEDEIAVLAGKYPVLFKPYIKDKKKYIEEIQGAKVAIEVSTSTGFIGAVAKLPGTVLYKVRDLFRKIFKEAVTTAVLTGNKV